MGRIGFYIGMTVVAAIALQFTGGKKAHVEANFGTSDPVMNVEAGNKAILAARDQAQATLPNFTVRLRDPMPDETIFTVKFQLKDSGCPVENIWASNLEPTVDGFKGTISGAPHCGPHIEGQSVSFSNSEVVDWGYMKSGVMQGNFTTKVLIDRMPENQKKAVREALGWS